MCHSVVTREGEADSCGELASLLGIALEELRMRGGDEIVRPEVCLCGVDIERTAERAGLVAFRPAFEGGDTMRWGMVPESEVRTLLTGESA